MAWYDNRHIFTNTDIVRDVWNHPYDLDSKQTYIDTHPTSAVWRADVLLIALIVFHIIAYLGLSKTLLMATGIWLL